MSKTIEVRQYEQKTGYYCGPATTKQTLYYINGTAPSQDNIAEALGTTTDGTDGHMIPPYLNEKQKRNKYVIYTNPDLSTLKERIRIGIESYDSPLIVRSKFTKGGNWKYSTNGHYMNISGYSTNMETIRVTDPNITKIDLNLSGSYYVTASEMLNAINDHPRQEFYW